jgi:transposase
MIIGKPAPFVRAFVDAVDEAIRAQSPSHGMSAMQRTWLAFCGTAVLVTNSMCWARFERASLGTYSLAALSWMFRHSKLPWDELLEAIRKVNIALTYGSLGYYSIFTEVSPMAVLTRKSYLTDLTDAQWAVLQPLMPRAKPGGRPRKVDLREVINTILYLNRTGCQWDMLPHDLLPKSTVYEYFSQWRNDGTWQRLMDALRAAVRQQQAPLTRAHPQCRQHRQPIGEDDGTGRRARL